MFVDIHQHFLPGLDDGAQNFAETASMLKASADDGVGHLFATPHIAPGRRPFDFARWREGMAAAADWVQKRRLPLRLYAGAEILYTEETVRLLREKRVPSLAGTRFVLMEFLPDTPLSRMLEAGRKLNNAGFVPIFAHIERYLCLKRAEHVRALKSLPEVRLQVNARTLLRRNGLLRTRFLREILRQGLVDFIASDAHNTGARPTCMRACHMALAQKYGEEFAALLMGKNQAEILEEIRSV